MTVWLNVAVTEVTSIRTAKLFFPETIFSLVMSYHLFGMCYDAVYFKERFEWFSQISLVSKQTKIQDNSHQAPKSQNSNVYQVFLFIRDTCYG